MIDHTRRISSNSRLLVGWANAASCVPESSKRPKEPPQMRRAWCWLRRCHSRSCATQPDRPTAAGTAPASRTTDSLPALPLLAGPRRVRVSAVAALRCRPRPPRPSRRGPVVPFVRHGVCQRLSPKMFEALYTAPLRATTDAFVMHAHRPRDDAEFGAWRAGLHLSSRRPGGCCPAAQPHGCPQPATHHTALCLAPAPATGHG